MKNISPEVLSYLFEIGYTGGLRERFASIVAGSRRLPRLLLLFPLEYFGALPASLYAKAVAALRQAGEHEKADHLIERLDADRVAADLFEKDDHEKLRALLDNGFDPMLLTGEAMAKAGRWVTMTLRLRCAHLCELALCLAAA